MKDRTIVMFEYILTLSGGEQLKFQSDFNELEVAYLHYCIEKAVVPRWVVNYVMRPYVQAA